jgi:hypothetical protein
MHITFQADRAYPECSSLMVSRRLGTQAVARVPRSLHQHDIKIKLELQTQCRDSAARC